MINGLGVLGWGVGGIEAEAAMLGQPVSMLIPQVVGFEAHRHAARRRDRDRPRAHRHADAPQEGRRRQVRRVLRRRASRSSRSPTARRSPTWRPSTARRAASSRSTPRRSRTCASPAAPRSRSRSSRRTARSRASSTTPSTPEPRYTDSLELDLATVEPSLAGPTRPQDRVTAHRRARRASHVVARRRCSRKAPKPSPRTTKVPATIDGKDVALAPRLRRHRGDHELHEHVEPVAS